MESELSAKQIYEYVPKDIRNAIGELIWRDSMTDVHREYKSTYIVGGVKYVQSKPQYKYFNIDENCDDYTVVEISSNLVPMSGYGRTQYNYRVLQLPIARSGSLIIKHQYRNVAVVPKTYIYSRPTHDPQYANAEQGALLYVKLYPGN